jgi:hypothetical protein
MVSRPARAFTAGLQLSTSSTLRRTVRLEIREAASSERGREAKGEKLSQQRGQSEGSVGSR